MILISSILKRIKNRLSHNGPENEFRRLRKNYGSVARFTHRTIDILDCRFEVPDVPSFIWQFKEIFVDESYYFPSEHPRPVIFDCGANIGTSCLYFKEKYPESRIRAYEADPKICEILQMNMDNNSIKDIEIINKAVWIDDRGVSFSIEGADGGSIHGGDNRIAIDSVRLRDEIEKEEKIDFLKLDVEGSETDILRDCVDVLCKVDYIFIEYHSWINRDQDLDIILKILTENRKRYYLDVANRRSNPFVNKMINANMDLQVNIFAYPEK